MTDEQKTETGDSEKTETEQEWDEAREKVQALEDDPPSELEEWPDDKAKYVTFGGGEGDHGYEEGPEQKLGPSSLRRFEDGSVEIDGEKVDNPDDYKMEPISNPASQTGEGEDETGEGKDDGDD